MFIAALFIIAKTWKQPEYPSTDECGIHSENVIPPPPRVQYYLVIKKKEILPFTVT